MVCKTYLLNRHNLVFALNENGSDYSCLILFSKRDYDPGIIIKVTKEDLEEAQQIDFEINSFRELVISKMG